MKNCGFISSFPEYVLDRTIVLGKGHEHKVSGYKLARASEYFRNQLKEIRIKELELFKQKDSEDNSVNPSKSETPQRTRTRSLSELEYDRIKVNYHDTYGLEFVLSFIHCQEELVCSKLKITTMNAKSILKAGIYFKIPTVIEFCLNQIKSNINFDDCWHYFTIGAELEVDYPPLIEYVEYFILENFESCTNSDKYVKIDKIYLENFLKNGFLNIRDEFKLFELVIKWINYKKLDRTPALLSLLKHLRLGYIKDVELQRIDSIVKDYKVTEESLVKMIKLARLSKEQQTAPGLEEMNEEDLQIWKYLHEARLPREAIVVVGGWEGNQDDTYFGPSKAIQIYDNRANLWKRIITDDIGLDEGHAYSGCVLYNKKIYVIGGYVSSGPTQTLKMFDLAQKQWRYMSPMHEKRNYITTSLLNGFIYAIGGHNGRNRLASVERYDPHQNHWSLVASMRQVRSDAGCDSLYGKLYVCGGFDGHHFYSSVEMYDPAVDQWSYVAPMANIRSGVSVVTYNKYLFAIGGNDGLQRLRTVERYDPVENRWQEMPPMLRQRSNFCLTILEDEIYVMGGWSDETNSTISLVEKWKPGLVNLWCSVQQLYMPASANCCCAVKGVESIKELLATS